MLPVRVRQVVGAVSVEPIMTPRAVLSERILSVTEPCRFVYCSISMPAAALEDKFWQLLIVFPEILSVSASMPVGA